MSIYIGMFLIAFSTLALEVTLTRLLMETTVRNWFIFTGAPVVMVHLVQPLVQKKKI